jgi:hypothetical protein
MGRPLLENSPQRGAKIEIPRRVSGGNFTPYAPRKKDQFLEKECGCDVEKKACFQVPSEVSSSTSSAT